MRIRTVKPEFFLHEGLFDLEASSGLPVRLSFAGLWCASDRQGRFKWEPRKLKAQILPYDTVDFSRVLDALTTRGFVVRYASTTGEFGCIPSFPRHQVINNRERESELPAPPEDALKQVLDACPTREGRVPHGPLSCTSGREGKGTRKGTSISPAADSDLFPGTTTTFQAEKIYEAYPMKKAKPEAIRKIKAALVKVPFPELLAKTQEFARVRNGDLSFCPNPSTWFNQERYNDNPETWKRNDVAQSHPAQPAREDDWKQCL